MASPIASISGWPRSRSRGPRVKTSPRAHGTGGAVDAVAGAGPADVEDAQGLAISPCDELRVSGGVLERVAHGAALVAGCIRVGPVADPAAGEWIGEVELAAIAQDVDPMRGRLAHGL